MKYDLNVDPTQIAFRWMLYGFLGVMEIEQVLLLWDRILAYDRLQLLPAAAAAIFIFRRDMLMAARNDKEVEVVFSDLQAIKVMPLLQHYLFVSGTEKDLLPRDMFSTVPDFEEDNE
ncbi:hypothetical protein HDU97_002698 [Phlyctochytrium planicorne]|nr:hypothetical protein HDU97_002698 [Phlyctochytrium planicorne]